MNQDEARRKVCGLIENEREEIVQTLRTLVRIPTLTGREGEGQKAKPANCLRLVMSE